MGDIIGIGMLDLASPISKHTCTYIFFHAHLILKKILSFIVVVF